MKKLAVLLPILSAVLVGCEQLPVATMPDGTKIDGGRTFLTKSAGKKVDITHPSGFAMNYQSTGHDETIVPVKGIGAYTKIGLAKELTNALRTTESTKRIVSGHEVQKTGIRSAERVRTTEILNPAPIEAALPVAAP